MESRPLRARTVAALGASPSEADELLAYTDDHFHPEQLASPLVLPLDPEPHVAVWEEYAAAVARAGSIDPLRDALVQLRFPVREGISNDDTYRRATRQGILPDKTQDGSQDGVSVRGPIRLVVHEHPAGRIPAILTSDRDDFVALVRALTARNEPGPVPASQGAVVVGGFNNWDRIRRYRREWELKHPGADEAAWRNEFARIVAEKWRYQDRFLLVSDGPYSEVPARDIGLSAEEWRARSVTLRLEHEAAHYFTRRVFGSMNNHVHDELIADWAGIRAAAGRFRADWFLRFMGLERFPVYREGGRLQNYRGSPGPLSDGAFRVLQAVTHRAATTLERFERERPSEGHDRRALAAGLVGLASVTLDEIASEEGLARLDRAARDADKRIEWSAFARRAAADTSR